MNEKHEAELNAIIHELVVGLITLTDGKFSADVVSIARQTLVRAYRPATRGNQNVVLDGNNRSSDAGHSV